MTFNPLYLLSFIFSVALAFFTTAFIVHCVIYCLRVRNHRICYVLRLLPFVGAILNLFTFDSRISSWLNPLSCSSCTQKLLLKLFFPDLQSCLSSQQISLINYLSFDDPYKIGLVLSLLFVCGTVYLLSYKLFQIAQDKKNVSWIVKTAMACTRSVTNPDVEKSIKSRSTQLLLSQEIQIPMATHTNTIIIPADIIDTLSQDEFEAVIAHELEHIKWKDAHIKVLIALFKSLFWWIPIKKWIQEIEQNQEMGCDQEILKYGFRRESLASALLKVATHIKNKKMLSVCYLAEKEKPILRRIRAILNCYSKEKFTATGIVLIITGLLLSLICLMH